MYFSIKERKSFIISHPKRIVLFAINQHSSPENMPMYTYSVSIFLQHAGQKTKERKTDEKEKKNKLMYRTTTLQEKFCQPELLFNVGKFPFSILMFIPCFFSIPQNTYILVAAKAHSRKNDPTTNKALIFF